MGIPGGLRSGRARDALIPGCILQAEVHAYVLVDNTRE